MASEYFTIESPTSFSESMIWKLNREYYQDKGISVWSEDVVPHHMTSNAYVGKTYAELIIALLEDLAFKGMHDEVVYILELGAGHGRLAFHVLKHLKKMIALIKEPLPRYCYILSDIGEGNLSFFQNHPQFKEYLDKGLLDVSYFDATRSTTLDLRYSQKTIHPKDLNQPIIAIANYFFDSIPNELFYVKNEELYECSVSLHSKVDPDKLDQEGLIRNIEMSYHNSIIHKSALENSLFSEILEDYRKVLSDSYLFFPLRGMECLQNIKALSNAGMVLLSMDKGFHEIQKLKNQGKPDIIRHGSLSLWVNYHALSTYCMKIGGKALFSSYSNFHLEMGCLLFLEDSESFVHLDAAYFKHVNEFGPDDFNSMKQLAYNNIANLGLKDIIALLRLSRYDSTLFIKFLTRIRQVYQTITVDERKRLAETLNHVWDMYFNINENIDLAYDMAGIFYDLGYYTEAINYFQHSASYYGMKADIYYNKAMCYYQLRDDQLFYNTLNAGKEMFPEFEMYGHLEKLDMS